MAHFSVDSLRERQREGGVETPLPEDEIGEQDGVVDGAIVSQSTEELTQPLGSDGGDSGGESGGSSGADTKQADADNHVAGLGTAKSEAEPKSRAK